MYTSDDTKKWLRHRGSEERAFHEHKVTEFGFCLKPSKENQHNIDSQKASIAPSCYYCRLRMTED